MNFLKKYYTFFIPIFFLAGFCIPFNGYLISGLVYFFLSWLGFAAFIFDFKLEYLKHLHILLAHGIPIFSPIIIYVFLLNKLVPYKLFTWIIKSLGYLMIVSYLLFSYYSTQDIFIDNFSFTFFNQSLWFLSAFLCLVSLYYSSKNNIINHTEKR